MPLGKICCYPEGLRKTATLSGYEECKQIPPTAAAKAMKNLFVGIDVERWMPFRMKWAETDVLPPSRAQLCIAPDKKQKIGPPFHLLRVEGWAVDLWPDRFSG
jgi:hypothetical protein